MASRGDSDPVNPDQLHNTLKKAEVTIYWNKMGEDVYGDSWPKGAFPAGATNVSNCPVKFLYYVLDEILLSSIFIFLG